MLRIRVRPDEGESFTVPLEAEELVIGRSSEAEVSINDRYMSRRHARVFHDDGRWWLEDLGSRNGTLVNGQRLHEPRPLHPGDSIHMSETVISIENAHTGGTISEAAHSIFRPASELLATTRHEGQPGSSDRLRILNEVHRALAVSIERDELLAMILDRVFDLLRPNEGAILLLDDEGEHYRAAYKATHDGDTHFWSETLAHEVIHKGMAALVTDVEQDRRFSTADSILSSGVRTLVAAPVSDGEGCFGMMALTSGVRERPFTEDDMELLVSLANVAALRIRNIRLTEEAIQRRELERELELAREIQVGLLPESLPEIEGYDLCGRNYPSRGVSGDYYYAAMHDDRLILMIADVSGKGISASLLTASLEALAAAPLESSEDPAEICHELSQRLFARTPAAKYATSFLALVDPASGTVDYVNAGHNPGLLSSGEELQVLDRGGLPLGLMPVADYEAGRAELRAGDTLVLYTDGITEAADGADDEYGEARLHAAIKANAGAPLTELADALEGDVAAFVDGRPFADDRTLVLLRRSRDC